MEQQTQTQQQPTEEEMAAAIAAMLIVSTTVPPAGAVAALLLVLVPRTIPVGIRNQIAADAASFIPDSLPRLRRASPALKNAYLENILFRAHYSIRALKRLSTAVMVRTDEDMLVRLKKALVLEEWYFARHREASRRRIAAVKAVDAAERLYGPLLGWRHGDPQEPRLTHLAADGKNFRAGTVPTSTGALPGALPGCTCSVVPPFRNARMVD